MSDFGPLHSTVLQNELPGLSTAFDAPTMQRHFEATLLTAAQPMATIVKCDLEQATYLLDTGCVLRYHLVVRFPGSEQLQPTIVSARLFPDLATCTRYHREQLLPAAERMRGRPEIAAFAVPIAVLAPLSIALFAFPIDPELPTLIHATDQAKMTGVLNDILPQALARDVYVDHCQTELVDYGRQYRCTLRYQLDVATHAATGAMSQRMVVYGKLTADGSGALAEPVSAALRRRASSSRVPFNVPRVLAWLPELELSLLEAIPGEPIMGDTVKARLRGKPINGAAHSLEMMLDASACMAATLHTSGISLGPRRTLDDELATLRQRIVSVEHISPKLGQRLAASLTRLAAAAANSNPLPLCFNHGDFTHGQLLFSGTSSGLVDFDSICQAEPALDLGHFLTYLRLAGLKAQPAPAEPHPLIAQLRTRFLQTYSETREHTLDINELQARIAVYQVLSLLRRVLRSWQKFKPSRIDAALALAESDLAQLP